MDYQNQPQFTSEVCYDLSLHKEYVSLARSSYGRNILFQIISLFCALSILAQFPHDYPVIAFLAFSVFVIIVNLVRYYKNKDGGVMYRQILYKNEGKAPHHFLSFEADCIHSKNLDTGRERVHGYEHIVSLMESKNLLVPVLDVNLILFIDKRTLTGGSRDELVAFLRANCPKLKKRIATGLLGRIMNYLMLTAIIVGSIWGCAIVLRVPEKLSGQISNDMSYQEIAAELEELDIHIDPAIIEELTQYEAEYFDGNPFLYYDYPKALNLLCWAGQADYEEDVFYSAPGIEAFDWRVVPSTSGVYWFDTEVINLDSIYTDFLICVDAMDEELAFTNITENYGGVSFLSGTGTVSLSFDYLDEHYELEAEFNDDWFDTDMLFAVGRILAADSDPHDLWFTTDQGQGLLLYYGTADQVAALAQKTGIAFYDTVHMTIGH